MGEGFPLCLARIDTPLSNCIRVLIRGHRPRGRIYPRLNKRGESRNISAAARKCQAYRFGHVLVRLEQRRQADEIHRKGGHPITNRHFSRVGILRIRPVAQLLGRKWPMICSRRCVCGEVLRSPSRRPREDIALSSRSVWRRTSNDAIRYRACVSAASRISAE